MTRILFFIMLLSLWGCSKDNDVVKDVKSSDNKLYAKAWVFINDNTNKKDSAFYYLNEAKDVFSKANDSLGVAKALVNMAIIQEEFGDNYGSIETSLQAIPYLNVKLKANRGFISSNYNNMGVASNSLTNYDNAVEFYKKALDFTDDPMEKMMISNNLANTYNQQKKYNEAIAIYDEILRTIKTKDEIYARIINNHARAQWSKNQTYNPLPQFMEALKIRKIKEDLWGLDGSYASLAKYYETTNKDSALHYADKMYVIAKELNSTVDQIDALGKKIRLDDNAKVKGYFAEFNTLKDSLNLAESKAKNQFALIRFESDKNKLENNKLHQENLKKKFEIRYHRLLIVGIIVAAIGAATVLIISEKRKRVRAALQAENEIKTNRLKTSKKVHDVVANGLYRVMTEIENSPNVDRNSLLYKLENMYESSRNISYQDDIEVNNLEFAEEISELLRTFDSETLRIFIVGNGDDIWENLNLTQKNNVYHILQELMVNMKKHSEASRVVLKFKKENNIILINYSDDGIGLGKDQVKNNGLTNTVNRINYLHGEITFVSENNSGLKISMTFPDS